MNESEKARFTSEVRSLRQRAEPLTTTPHPAGGVPGEEPRRRTTRFRLERISLLPFVPAPLIAYVERARDRRRARLLVVLAIVSGAAVVLALWLLFGPRPSAVTETPRRESLKRDRPDHASAAPVPVIASLAAAPSPADSAAREARDGAPPATPSGSKRILHGDVDRSARPRPKGASSAWWW